MDKVLLRARLEALAYTDDEIEVVFENMENDKEYRDSFNLKLDALFDGCPDLKLNPTQSGITDKQKAV